MPSTPTSRLRLEKMALGENLATWGAPKLNDIFDRLDEAVAGVQAITISGTTTTLSSANYSTDQARKPCLVLSGALTANSVVVVPNSEKLYLAINNTTGAFTLTIKTAAGTGYALRGGPQWVYCDGTNVSGATPRLDQTPLPTAPPDLNAQRISNVGTPTVSSDAATKAYVDAAVSTTPTQNLASNSGTALAPTYSWATDSNTGMYNAGADSIGFAAGGVARATLGTAGLAVTGTLSASGAVTASAGLGVTGALTTTTLGVSGASTLAGLNAGATTVGTLSASGAATFSSTLGVTGTTTLGTLSAGAATVTGLGVTGAATVGSTLGVTGTTTLAGVNAGAASVTTLSTSGAATLASLGVTGAATVGGTLTSTGAITATAGLNAGGAILTALGTAGAPSRSFTGDTNTGLYSPGADIVAVSTGGTERLRVTAAGDVGIGSPTIVPAADVRYFTIKGASTGLAYASLRLQSGVSTSEALVQCSGTSADLLLQSDGGTSVAAGTNVLLTTAGTEKARMTATGEFLIGQASTTVPGFGNTTVGQSIRTDGRWFSSVASGGFSNMNMNGVGAVLVFSSSSTTVGSIGISGVATSYNTSSDYRLKEDIEPLTLALDRLALLQPKRFRFKSAPELGPFDGFLAHEVSPAVPEAVTGEKDGELMQAIDPSKLVPLLVAAVKELARRVEMLEDTV
jgi:hypothetical protein